MVKEELKQKAKDFIDRINKESGGNWLDKYYLTDLLVMFATEATKELREVQLLSQHILDLQKDKGKLTDRVTELEQQIEKMKCLLNEIYSEFGFSELVKIRNNLPIEIQEVIKEIKEK